MVSALIPSKHVTEGIRAAAKVPGLFLVVAGDGECRRDVDEEARRLMPGRFVRLSLAARRMPGLYRCADALLHMSRDEPSGIAYTEAMATGLPIVTHDWEVTRWTLPDHDLLVDSTDEKAVTAALARAIEDKSEEKIQRRRELVERRFSWSQIGREYSDFLLQLCGAAAIIDPIGERLEDVGVVAIGRNEGQRLVRCLESVRGKAAAVVYVDSASDDQSIASRPTNRSQSGGTGKVRSVHGGPGSESRDGAAEGNCAGIEICAIRRWGLRSSAGLDAPAAQRTGSR